MIWYGDKLRVGKVCRLHIVIRTVQSKADDTGLQKEFRALNNRMIKGQIKFNAGKYEVMHMGRNSNYCKYNKQVL